MRIALGTLPFAGPVTKAVKNVFEALEMAAAGGATLMCTPENYLPGLRGIGFDVDPAPQELEALDQIGDYVAAARVALVLGAELPTTRGLVMTSLVYDQDGRRLGRQDKVQLDPSEERTFIPSLGRSIFDVAGLRFGISICHEGWRYPETVRRAARRGAQLVLHPHMSLATSRGRAPERWADGHNSFHEKAAMCRAAENSNYSAIVNHAVPWAETASAVINPDGSLLAYLPHGRAGVLIADIDPCAATGILARRYRPGDHDAPIHRRPSCRTGLPLRLTPCSLPGKR